MCVHFQHLKQCNTHEAKNECHSAKYKTCNHLVFENANLVEIQNPIHHNTCFFSIWTCQSSYPSIVNCEVLLLLTSQLAMPPLLIKFVNTYNGKAHQHHMINRSFIRPYTVLNSHKIKGDRHQHELSKSRILNVTWTLNLILNQILKQIITKVYRKYGSKWQGLVI